MKKYIPIYIVLACSFFVGVPVVHGVTLPVPFTAQAPFADWRQPWQDACEESVITMVDHYYAGKELDKQVAKKEILKAFHIKEKYYGTSLDEGAEKMQDWINNFYNWEARIVENPTTEQIKNEINNRRPVIALTHGRYLYNQYFRDGGPDYHTIVISGYDDETNNFITQEPGTRRGLDFRYSYDRIMTAIRDFVPGKKTKNGKRIVLFTQPNSTSSALLDGDNDGLNKAEELIHGTSPWNADTDGDGYEDGVEVTKGYLATTNEKKFLNGGVVKSPHSPKVFLLSNGAKRHILNERVFLRHGWQWHQIKLVSENFLSRIKTGAPVDV